MITKLDIESAAERIANRVRVTPVVHTEAGAFGVAEPLALKLELLQHTGSFKPRGVFNRVLSAGAPKVGVIAASGGNAGAAVAYAARELGLPAEIFVPEASSPVKVARLHSYGARVTVTGAYYADAYAASLRRAEETGALIVHAYDQPEVAAGQGTLGMELTEQLAGIDVVFVAVGGGGLLAGVATWLRGVAKVIAVEPQQCASLAIALKQAQAVDVPVGGIAADSLGARRISTRALEIARRDHIASVLVSDEAILRARKALWDECRVAAEPGGATALAALTSGAYRILPGERAAVIICGGNTDPGDLVERR